MNPFRQAGDVDKTPIEIARIQEAGATKRKLIEEREETKRKMDPFAYTFVRLFAVGGVIAVCEARGRSTRRRWRGSADGGPPLARRKRRRRKGRR
jgi:hypothetical protein